MRVNMVQPANEMSKDRCNSIALGFSVKVKHLLNSSQLHSEISRIESKDIINYRVLLIGQPPYQAASSSMLSPS